jgi:hypothetical protein
MTSLKSVTWKMAPVDTIKKNINDRLFPLVDKEDNEPMNSWSDYPIMFTASNVSHLLMDQREEEDLKRVIEETERMRKNYVPPSTVDTNKAIATTPVNSMDLKERRKEWGKLHQDTALADFLYSTSSFKVEKRGFKDKFFFLYSEETGRIEHIHFGAKINGLLIDGVSSTIDSLIDVKCPAPYAKTVNGKSIKHVQAKPDEGISAKEIPQIMMEMAVFNLDTANVLKWSPTAGWNLYSIAFHANYFKNMMELLLHYQTEYLNDSKSDLKTLFKKNERIKKLHQEFLNMSEQLVSDQGPK